LVTDSTLHHATLVTFDLFQIGGGMFTRSVLCLAVMVGLGFSASAQAGDVCSTRGIAGHYIVRCSGFSVDPKTGASTPVAALLLEHRERGGQSSGSGTISLGGAVAPMEISGSAQVNEDCTGTEHYSQTIGGQPAPSSDFNFIVETDARQIDAILSDQGFVFTCTDTRVNHE
jgi:hypothetical protein